MATPQPELLQDPEVTESVTLVEEVKDHAAAQSETTEEQPDTTKETEEGGRDIEIVQNEAAKVPETSMEGLQSATKETTKESETPMEGSKDIDASQKETENPLPTTKENATGEDKDIDLYGYIDGDFTTEIYKIEITNLPRRYGIRDFKKQLVKLDLKPSKIKVSPNMKFAFVNFRCEEHRQAALQACAGHTWKGQIWKVKVAKPAADPLLKKRKLVKEGIESGTSNKKMKSDDENLPVAERLQKAVTPLAHLSYEEQLEVKAEELKKILQSIASHVEKEGGERPAVVDGPLNLIRSPVEKDYRNKAEMTIGTSPEGEEKVVGFRLGSYKNASISVVSPADCVHIPTQMKELAKVFQKYLQTVSKYPAFEPITRSGNWKQVMFRTTQTGQCMVVPQFHPQSLSKEEIEAEKQQVKEYFENGEGKECQITSLYFQVQKDRGAPISTEVILGDKYIIETMLGMKFRVSPESFFQINTCAAEVLYKKIGDLCGLDGNAIFFDVCCGTGTIGLSVAKRVKKVIGIEMVQQAIDDAHENVKLNEIDNVEFVCAKAEDAIHRKLMEVDQNTRCIVVVDPPRNGLHPNVVKKLRQVWHMISDVIYVSCNPASAEANLIDLMRRPTLRIKGEPYVLKEVVGVDMFPSTTHVEAIFHFKSPEC